MDLLQTISGLFGTNQHVAGAQGNPVDGAQGLEGLQKLLGPAALGGLAGALFGKKSITGALKGAMVASGGAYLWDKYKDRFREYNAEEPQFQGGSTTSRPAERAERMIRAMIYAAKADGHIDDLEKTKIVAQIKQMNLGQQGQEVVNKALQDPLDPTEIARGVTDEEEALQLFALSCASISLDNALEKNYIDSLAQALYIPNDIKTDIENKIHGREHSGEQTITIGDR